MPNIVTTEAEIEKLIKEIDISKSPINSLVKSRHYII